MVPEYKTIMWESPKYKTVVGVAARGGAANHCGKTSLTGPDEPSQPEAGFYLMSFQNAAFRRQAISVNTPRNNITHTPMRTRVLAAGSAIHCR